MQKLMIGLFFLLTANIAGCAKAPVEPTPLDTVLRDNSAPKAYVAPQSAPVLPPSYPSLGGSPVQTGTASIPIVQGR